MGEADNRRDSIVLDRTQVGIAVLSAVALLALNVVQFLYVLNPSLRPDPRETQHAELRVVAIENGLTLERFLQRTTDPPALRSAERAEVRARFPELDMSGRLDDAACRKWTQALNESGYGVYVRVTVEGLKRRRVALSAAVYDVPTGERFEPTGQYTRPPRRLSSPTDTYVELVFVPVPRDPVPHYLQLELRTVEDGDRLGTLLGLARSGRIARFEPPPLPPPQLSSCPATR